MFCRHARKPHTPKNTINFNLVDVIAFVFAMLLSGCSSGIDSSGFGPFQRSLNSTTHGYQITPDLTGSAPTELIEIFDVRPGDCSLNDGWNDCKKDRERSELSEINKSTHVNSEYWYGWSIYFPDDYVNVFPTKASLGQFHQKGSHPVWMFQNSAGGYHLDNQVLGQTTEYYALIDDKDLRGRWHHIEVNVRWATDPSGFFDVWVNGEQKVGYQGQTMDASIVYFKYGLYRSFLSRYKTANNANEVPAQTVYFSNVKRSQSRRGLIPDGD
ncbi:heparin lyase I family protein [Enterovibrio sp. FF113]|uniref:heparin lyase I family protein n=1 Tax=Enterovibrio sp. FF113 TaxID=3230010 RepID=UPI00352DBE4D